ncbi:hypothetical protein JCM19235_2484 [Vibrio maritimus]|uniref:Uncharacterized protein n=1 Tax=Vibrio maritimus TaxID=990268 RepID=A0A090RUW7_9VIBR|nr:hypothetical protein JCM19235_2484 [Vibrio maritimus]
MKLESLAPCHFDMLFEFERDNKAWFEQYVPARPASYSQNASFVTAQHALLEEQCCETSLFLVLIDEAVLPHVLTSPTSKKLNVSWGIESGMLM